MRFPHLKRITYLLSTSILLTISVIVSAQDTVTPDDLFIEGMRHYNENEYQQAVSVFSKVIEDSPEHDAALYYIALSHIALNDIHTGELFLEKAVSIAPTNYWYQERLAKLYYETRRTDLAIKAYEKLLAEHPTKSSMLYDILSLYSELDMYDKALKTLDKIEAIKGKNELTAEIRYEFHLRDGNYTQAYKAAQECFEKYPSPKVAFILGDLNKSMLKDSLAIEYYKLALDMDPKYTLANLGIAESAYNMMDLSTFFENINIFLTDKAVPVAAKNNYVKKYIPVLYRSNGEEAEKMVTNVVNTHPTDTAALYMAGAYYFQLGKDSLGLDMFKRGADAYPEDYKINMEYCSVLYYTNSWQTLINHIDKLLTKFSDDLGLREMLAISYWQNGQINQAISQYDKMIKLAPKGSPILHLFYSSMGDLYHEQGETKKSYSCYEKALKINPDYNPTLNNYAYFLCLEGKKLKKAASMSKKTILSEPDNPTYLDTYAWILYHLGEYTEAKIHMKRAIVYGGNEEPTLLDHYAEILYALGEYDLAFIYWEQAEKKDPLGGYTQKIQIRKDAIKK